MSHFILCCYSNVCGCSEIFIAVINALCVNAVLQNYNLLLHNLRVSFRWGKGGGGGSIPTPLGEAENTCII